VAYFYCQHYKKTKQESTDKKEQTIKTMKTIKHQKQANNIYIYKQIQINIQRQKHKE